MSRFDYTDPGTDPAYCDPLRAEDDIDVPDFDQPDPFPPVEEPWPGAIDPAEHAAHALIDAIATLEQQIALCPETDLERARQLYALVFRHEAHVQRVTNQASAKVDAILERRR